MLIKGRDAQANQHTIDMDLEDLLSSLIQTWLPGLGLCIFCFVSMFSGDHENVALIALMEVDRGRKLDRDKHTFYKQRVHSVVDLVIPRCITLRRMEFV